jgi:hypothetical protein
MLRASYGIAPICKGWSATATVPKAQEAAQKSPGEGAGGQIRNVCLKLMPPEGMTPGIVALGGAPACGSEWLVMEYSVYWEEID